MIDRREVAAQFSPMATPGVLRPPPFPRRTLDVGIGNGYWLRRMRGELGVRRDELGVVRSESELNFYRNHHLVEVA